MSAGNSFHSSNALFAEKFYGVLKKFYNQNKYNTNIALLNQNMTAKFDLW